MKKEDKNLIEIYRKLNYENKMKFLKKMDFVVNNKQIVKENLHYCKKIID